MTDAQNDATLWATAYAAGVAEGRRAGLEEAADICKRWSAANIEVFHEQALAVECVERRIRALIAQPPGISLVVSEAMPPDRIAMGSAESFATARIAAPCPTCHGTGRVLVANASEYVYETCPECVGSR
jgi:hypothetical protein